MFVLALSIGISGIFLALAGYKYLKKVILTIGFVIVTGMIITLLHFILGLQLILAIAAGTITGLVFTFFLSGLFEIAIFFFGASATSLAFLAISYSTAPSEFAVSNVALPSAGLFIAGGILTMVFRKYILVMSTALVGAILILSSIFLFNSSGEFSFDGFQKSISESSAFILISTPIILVLSILIQLGKISFVTSLIKSFVPNFSHENEDVDQLSSTKSLLQTSSAPLSEKNMNGSMCNKSVSATKASNLVEENASDHSTPPVL